MFLLKTKRNLIELPRYSVGWQQNSSDFLNNSEFAENNLHPDFVDIDFDEDYDLFIGDFNGLIHYFENAGDINNPIMKYHGPIDGIDLSGYSSPEFVDIDIPHPRSSEVVSSEKFGKLVGAIWNDLREEASLGMTDYETRSRSRI